MAIYVAKPGILLASLTHKSSETIPATGPANKSPQQCAQTNIPAKRALILCWKKTHLVERSRLSPSEQRPRHATMLRHSDPTKNHLLATLPKAEFDRLAEHLELVELQAGDTLYESHGELKHVFFPTTAIVSLLYEMENGETVMVKIKFIVGYDGVLKGFETVQDGGAAFNEEVIRVLKKMPQWIPGKTKGENVSVYNMIPVKFTGAD